MLFSVLDFLFLHHLYHIALASFGYMCWKLSGNVNKDVGLQTALHIAHETAHK